MFTDYTESAASGSQGFLCGLCSRSNTVRLYHYQEPALRARANVTMERQLLTTAMCARQGDRDCLGNIEHPAQRQ